MSLGLLAQKLGMTQLFLEDGLRIPVTILQVTDNHIVQKRDLKTDGYLAVQVGAKAAKEKNLTKALLGHFKKHNVPNLAKVVEFRVTADESAKVNTGEALTVSFLEGVKSVDVAGISKGRGTAGVMKRHNMKGFRATHGTHEYFRHGGSIGCRAVPGKVHKGKRMPGRMGNERVSVLNLAVVKLDLDQGLIFVRGAVPGPKGSMLEVKASTHKSQKGRAMAGEAQVASKNPMKASKAGGTSAKKK